MNNPPVWATHRVTWNRPDFIAYISNEQYIGLRGDGSVMWQGKWKHDTHMDEWINRLDGVVTELLLVEENE